MGRNLSSPLLSSIASNHICPAFLAVITFRSSTQYIWTGVGNLSYGGNVYRGVGAFGKMGAIAEGTQVEAQGTSVTLSGIDPALLSDCMTDIQVGASAALYFALLDTAAMTVLGTAYPCFSGRVDQPVLDIGLDTLSITLKLESRLSNLQRANLRRYTSADQQLYYPGDTGFNFVELLNDIALKWS